MARRQFVIADRIYGCAYRPATGVAENHDGLNTENGGREFEADDAVLTQEISSDAYDEQIARRLIEDQFRHHARIRAGDDRGKGRLAGSPGVARHRVVGIVRRVGDIARIAVHQALDRLIGGSRRGGRGLGESAPAKRNRKRKRQTAHQ